MSLLDYVELCSLTNLVSSILQLNTSVSRLASLEIILERSNKEYSDGEKEIFCEYKNNVYRNLLSNMTKADLSDEVKQTLEELRKRGYKMSIGSSSKNTKFILERIGLDGFFDAISDGTNITRSKPDPQVFNMAAEFLGLKSEECLVVEDALAGIDAAKAGGMFAAGLLDAKKYEKTDYPLETFSDLLKILIGN